VRINKFNLTQGHLYMQNSAARKDEYSLLSCILATYPLAIKNLSGRFQLQTMSGKVVDESCTHTIKLGISKSQKLLITKSKAFRFNDSSYRRHFDLDKKNEIHYHSWKEHLKMSKIAKFGCKML
jgi:hypothetical protein